MCMNEWRTTPLCVDITQNSVWHLHENLMLRSQITIHTSVSFVCLSKRSVHNIVHDACICACSCSCTLSAFVFCKQEGVQNHKCLQGMGRFFLTVRVPSCSHRVPTVNRKEKSSCSYKGKKQKPYVVWRRS